MGRSFFVCYWNSAGGTMPTLGLSLASTAEPAGAAAGEPGSSAFAISRRAGGGGGLKVGARRLAAAGLRWVETGFGFARAGASPSP